MNTARDMKYAPVVKLGPEFKLLQQYLRRVPHIPNLVDLEHLTVSGDVHFGRDVVLKVSSRVGGCCCLLCPWRLTGVPHRYSHVWQGTVIIVANEGCRIDIPDGSVLEDKVITGNLRILEH